MKKARHMKMTEGRVETAIPGRPRIWQVFMVLLLTAGIAFPALSEEDLVAWYPFNGNAVDESGNGNDGIVIGATLADDRFGNPNSAYCFDGLDDYINIGNNVKPPLPFTVSTWIKVESLPVVNACVFRNDRYNSASYRNGIALVVRSDGTVGANVFEGFSAPWNRQSKVSNDSVITIGSWHHFAVVFNAYNDMQIFWDGEEIDGYYDGTGSGLSYSGSDGAIGLYYRNIGGTGVAQYFHGCIDDICVYDRSLSAAEIAELYSSSPVPPPGNLPPVAICQDVVVQAGDGCASDALIDDGSYDPDGDAITIEQDPAGPYPLGVTPVTLTVTDEHGASATCAGLVTVQDTTPPIVSATVTPQDVPVGGEVSFVGTVGDECGLTAEWDFGDGNTSTDIVTAHVYDAPGSYTATLYAIDSSGNVSTEEFTVVVSAQIEALVDIKPGSCPNPFNPKSQGRVPVAIVATEDFDPTTAVDLSTIQLAGVSPIDADVIDSTQPGDYDPGDCYNCFNADDYLTDSDGDGIFSYEGDGHPDLVLYFDTQELAAAIGHADKDACLELELTGETVDGVPIVGSDSIWVLKAIDGN